MPDVEQTDTWPDLAIGPYYRLNGRNVETTHDMEHTRVPSGTGAGARHAERVLDGRLRVATRDLRAGDASPK